MENEIITILSEAPRPMMSRDIAEQLGESSVTDRIGRTLMSLRKADMIIKRGRYYSIPVEETEAEADKAPKAHAVQSLEDAEQRVEAGKGVKAALDRLEVKINATAVSIPHLQNASMKEAMLCKLEQIMEESIAVECRELREWMDEVFKAARK